MRELPQRRETLFEAARDERLPATVIDLRETGTIFEKPGSVGWRAFDLHSNLETHHEG